jgi:hypothetical protein
MDRRIHRVARLAFAACVASCGKADRDAIVVADVPAPYRELFEGWVANDQVASVWAGFPYDRLRLERWCVWGGPNLGDLEFHRGGRAVLRGPVDGEQGAFEGTIDVFDYGKLCYALQKLDFEGMKARYSDEGFDVEESILTATSPRGTKQVVDHGDVGPIGLWTLRAAFDGVRARIHWQKAK